MSEIKRDELIGVVISQGKWGIYHAYLGEWIMDYARYDPSYDAAADGKKFRNGLLVVDDSSIRAYLEWLEPYSVSLVDLSEFAHSHGFSKARPVFLVNFDEHLFVTGFYDVAIEGYVPQGWRGVYADPVEHLPQELIAFFLGLEPELQK